MATETSKKMETVEEYFREVVDRYGVDNWKAIDMAIHAKKFVDFRKASELDSKAQKRDQEDARIADLARRRERRLEKARACAQFRKSWLAAGYENWRKNQLVKLRRQQRERRFQHSLLEKKKAVERHKKEKSAAEACEGISWVENRMDSLGISSHTSADTAQTAHNVVSESGTAFLQRIEGQVANVTNNSEEVATLLAALKIRGNQNRTARSERELRRQKMEVDQQRERTQLELKKKEDRALKLCLQYSRALEAVAILKWKKVTKKLKDREESDARIALKKQRFDERLVDALEKFSTSARERQTEEAAIAIRSKINEMRRISRERRFARAKIVCTETVDKLVDLTCCVLREREQREDKLMSEPTWRKIKERFVSGHPFFKKRMQTVVKKGIHPEADAAATTEIKELCQGSGSWRIDSYENSLSLAKEPTAIALATMHELISEIPPSIRPYRVPANFSQCDIRMSVTGDAGTIIDATTTVCANHGLNAITISKVVERALELARAEDTSRAGETTKAGKKLRENGIAIARIRAEAAHKNEAGPEEIAFPDVLLIDTLVAYLDELNENDEDQSEGAQSKNVMDEPARKQTASKPGSWILAGFPRTKIQAKLLEHHLSNYNDPDVDAALAAYYKKGNKKDTKKDQDIHVLTSSLSAVLIVHNSNSESMAKSAHDDHGEHGIANEGSSMHDLEKWWSTLNPNTIPSRALNHRQIEEDVDVLIEVCHDRKHRETRRLTDEGPDISEDGEAKAKDVAKLGDFAEFCGKDEQRTIENDISEKVKTRIEALSLAQRIWRAHVLGERLLDRVRIKEAVANWEAEEEAYAAALDSFVYALHEQSEILQQEILSASERFRSHLGLDDNLWDSITNEARDQLNNLEFGIAAVGWSQLEYTCEVEKRLYATVDERKDASTKLLREMMAGLEVPLKDALDHLSVSAVLLAAAEASYFSCGLRFLDEYAELIDDKVIVGEQPDNSARLLDMLSFLERAQCAAEVRDRAIHASKLAAPYVNLEDRQTPRASDAVLLACHFVRRLHSIMCRFNAITLALHSSTFDIQGSFIARIERRHSKECKAVGNLIRACLTGKGKPILFQIAMECKGDNPVGKN